MTTMHLALSGAQAQATDDGLITAGTAVISVVPAGVLQLAPHAWNELFIGVEGQNGAR